MKRDTIVISVDYNGEYFLSIMFQIQVNYREKVRQFYINEILTDYSQLIESIVTNINSLFGCVFQVQYLNDEDIWITLGGNREDVRDMFRCSRIIENAEFKRVKIKIVEGCSHIYLLALWLV